MTQQKTLSARKMAGWKSKINNSFTVEFELWRNAGPSAFQLQETMLKSNKIWYMYLVIKCVSLRTLWMTLVLWYYMGVHLANTIGRLCGGGAALCKITLATWLTFYTMSITLCIALCLSVCSNRLYYSCWQAEQLMTWTEQWAVTKDNRTQSASSSVTKHSTSICASI